MQSTRAIWLSLALVAIAYFVQLPTPLRVNTDGLSYLTIAASFNDGHGFLWHGKKSHFPSGYPAIIAMLERVGAGNSAGLIAWNYLMMAVSTACGVWLLQNWLELPKKIALLIGLLNLLSWTTQRYALIPGSEPTYIAISSICLCLLTQAETIPTQKRWGVWIIAAALVPLALSVRLVGITLPPAVVWALILIFWNQRRHPEVTFFQWISARKKMFIGFAIAAFCSLAIGCFILSRISYVHEDIALMLKHGPVNEEIFTLKQRFLEASSMLTNIPSKNVLDSLHRSLRILGIPALAFILLIVARRLRRPRSVDLYLFAYVCLLLLWPYEADVRFWLPIQLLLFGVVAREFLDTAAHWPQKAQSLRLAGGAWIAAFTILGIATFAWNTRVSYSGTRFSELWDLHSFKDTYRSVIPDGLPPNPDLIKPELVAMLKRFGKPYFTK